MKPLALGWALGSVILCGRQSGSLAEPDSPPTAEAEEKESRQVLSDGQVLSAPIPGLSFAPDS